MKFRTAQILAGCGLLLTSAALAAPPKDKEPPAQMVDSGSFGVWTGGHRVATETFSVQQQSGGTSVIASQLKEDAGSASQNSELQVTSAGALVRYEWHEQSPGKSELFVVPNNDFLKETVTQNPGDKPAEQPFLMPSTSLVLDNNFLIHREVLAWRYLSGCNQEKGALQCGPAQFGAIVPQERTSIRVSIQPVGEEKITVRGTDRHLLRLNLKSDDDEWALWLDPQDHYKLIRVVKTGDNTEVVRD